MIACEVFPLIYSVYSHFFLLSLAKYWQVLRYNV